MLRDADPTKFAGIYVVCGFTDMRYGMDHLAAIIESRYHISLFVPNTLFLFCGKRTSKIKGLVWEGDRFFTAFLCAKRRSFLPFSDIFKCAYMSRYISSYLHLV